MAEKMKTRTSPMHVPPRATMRLDENGYWLARGTRKSLLDQLVGPMQAKRSNSREVR